MLLPLLATTERSCTLVRLPRVRNRRIRRCRDRIFSRLSTVDSVGLSVADTQIGSLRFSSPSEDLTDHDRVGRSGRR